MVGGNITLADVQLYFNLNGLFRFVYGEKVRAGFPNLMAWFNHVST
jgi:glutathione S-transferase